MLVFPEKEIVTLHRLLNYRDKMCEAKRTLDFPSPPNPLLGIAFIEDIADDKTGATS